MHEMKELVGRLDPSDPLRILVLGEPDELPRPEYATKVVGWFRLIASRVGPGRPGGRSPP